MSNIEANKKKITAASKTHSQFTSTLSRISMSIVLQN